MLDQEADRDGAGERSPTDAEASAECEATGELSHGLEEMVAMAVSGTLAAAPAAGVPVAEEASMERVATAESSHGLAEVAAMAVSSTLAAAAVAIAVATEETAAPPPAVLPERSPGGLSASAPIGTTEGAPQDEASGAEGEDLVPVFDLRCGACSELFCRRGMCVQLVADSSAELFSTDYRPTGVAEAGSEREHGSCRCVVRDVACTCGHPLGYHVIRPCSACCASGHNDHYWQMNTGMVVAERRVDDEGRPVTWLTSSTISLDMLPSSQRAAATVYGTTTVVGSAHRRAALEALGRLIAGDAPLDLCCPICHELMVEPVSPPCRHAACLLCLTRAVDLRRECPCCRRPTTCTELRPAKDVAGRIGALLAAAAGSTVA